ncbi:MAG TPA: PHP domain-containing protein [Candidatus Sulfotelmatobacter sp.]|nr:PHP domain-containing protein [Candidatus Sulfotelmatobacter sp.]
MPYAELHCHSCFSFLDGASPAEDLVARAQELGLSALALTDHQGLYGAVRFVTAAEEAGLRPIIGLEVELLDTAVPDPGGLVLPARRRPARRGSAAAPTTPVTPAGGRPVPPRTTRLRVPGHRVPRREDLRGIRDGERGPHLVLLARDATGYRSLCRLASAAHLAGTKGVPRFDQALLARHAEGLVALSGCRHSEIARRLLAGDRAGALAVARRYTALYPAVPGLGSGFFLEAQHHLRPDDDLLVALTVELAAEAGLPLVVTNDVHYADPDDHELQDVLVAIRHGLTLETSAHLRRDGAVHALRGAAGMAALPPGQAGAPVAVGRAWQAGIGLAHELGSRCVVDLGFERYRFPGFQVPDGVTPLQELTRLCGEGLARRYRPVTPAIQAQLDHELGVIDRTGLAEFFLICWDLMRFAREQGIPAQGRGSAGDSIVAYVLGITRVDPIRHRLLFERFINEGRTAYPDVDIDFASSRREEVIQYVYDRYGEAHTGMVCNVVTYRARSAVREVGYAMGFPRPLVDRVAKALETYDSVMVRRDLEAEGGFAEFFRAPGEEPPPVAAGRAGAAEARRRGLVDGMGRLDRPAGRGRPARRGTTDDEGGPGDTPVSVAWLRDEAAAVDPESGVTLPATRRIDGAETGREHASTAGLSPWERWLELCARLDGFPRHLSIHTGGMLVTAAPLVDIAPLERATMPGRVVVQYDKRDVETLKLIKLDLLGLRMLSAIDDALRDIEADCGLRLDLDELPEDLPEVFAMIQAADTVGVFQIESRAQMQTLPRSRPSTLDDLVVEVAIIRPGPIQGNAVHPYLRRRQGLEPVTYLHPSLEPILSETLGVILYQEQVMRIAIEVAGFSPGGSDGFRRAMGTWRSTAEMEKLHRGFVDGCRTTSGLPEADAEELFRRVAGFASFGFNKSHAAAFARTAYESAYLKLHYPAQFVTGLINAQPMGFYPVEVLVNDARRHGVPILPVDLARSRYRTATEWTGGRDAPRLAAGYGIRLGLHLVNGIGEELGQRLEAEAARGPYRSLEDVVARTGLPEETLERLIRAGALDGLGQPRREALWQVRELAGAIRGRTGERVAGRPLGLRLPPTPAPVLPPPSELERLGDSYAILSLDARRQVVELFRPALDHLGAVPSGDLTTRTPGPVAIGGLVVTRQHPMTAKGTVFLALEDETGMVNVTLWPDAWARLRGVVRRHALLYVEGTLQREHAVVNLIAHRIRSLPEVARAQGGPPRPHGVRHLGHAGMRVNR